MPPSVAGRGTHDVAWVLETVWTWSQASLWSREGWSQGFMRSVQADQNGLILTFFYLDSWPWVRGSNHLGWFSSAARLQIRTDSYKHNLALLYCNPVPVLHFMTAGSGCKSQQEITLKLSQVFKGNTPLSPLPEAVPASCRSPCPELRAQITLVPPWLFHRPLCAAWGAACAGQMQPQGQDSRWVPRGISQWNTAAYSVLQEAPSCHGGSQPEPHSDGVPTITDGERHTFRKVQTKQAGNNHIHWGSGDPQFIVHLLEGEWDRSPVCKEPALPGKAVGAGPSPALQPIRTCSSNALSHTVHAWCDERIQNFASVPFLWIRNNYFPLDPILQSSPFLLLDISAF